MNSDPIDTGAASRPTSRAHRVLVVDDHAQTLAAIGALLDEHPGIEVIGMARNGTTALHIVREAAPNVVVLDLDLGEEYGLDLMPAISSFPGVAVIILTSSDDPLERRQALGAGAAAFVNKVSPAAELIAAIRAVQPAAT